MNDDPIAFFLTWVSYGTWLPADERGWVEYRHGFQLPNSEKEWRASLRMTEDACYLQPHQREIVERQIAETCQVRGWTLHIASCRTNHVHVVVTAQNVKTKTLRDQLKAWCTRRLNEDQVQQGIEETAKREKWWAERGSIRWVWTMESLAAVIEYAGEQQDNRRRFLAE
jgi:REP element-mobilizing transposase RayT